MFRLLGLLFLGTILAPIATGILALAAGFGDPWGMGNPSRVAIFVSGAVPIIPPGINHVFAWPATFGVALVLSPLAAFGKDRLYRIAVFTYLGAIVLAWLAGWRWAPELLNGLVDLSTFQPGRLNKGVWQLGLFLMVDAALVAIAVLAWRRRVESRLPGKP